MQVNFVVLVVVLVVAVAVAVVGWQRQSTSAFVHSSGNKRRRRRQLLNQKNWWQHQELHLESSSNSNNNNNINDDNDDEKTAAPLSSSSSSSSSSLLSPAQLFLRTVQDSKRHLIAAAVARGISMLALYPVDTIKTRIQMGQLDPFRVNGLLNGVVGSLVGQIPYGVLTFGSYQVYKTMLFQHWARTTKTSSKTTDAAAAVTTGTKTANDNHDEIAASSVVNPVVVYAVAAVLGDLTGSLWLCPSEVLKQQMQAGIYYESTTVEAIHSIWETSGLAGFYTGYVGAICRDVPFRVIQLTTFEVTKTWALQWKSSSQQTTQRKQPPPLPKSIVVDVQQPENVTKVATTNNNDSVVVVALELSSLEAALCGAMAGTLAAAITSPLDRIKTLLMTAPQEVYGGSVLSCATKIWKDEGWQGLFVQGLVPRILYIAPLVMIFFVVYEQTQQQLNRWEEASTVATVAVPETTTS